MKKEFPTINALAVSIAAFEYNKRTVVRNAIETESDDKIFPNRQIIQETLMGIRPLVVNEFHTKEAEGIVIYLQQTMIMQSLKGRSDRFLGQMTELLSNQTVRESDLGLLAWAPKVSDDYQRKDRIREVSARYEHHSRYVGHPRDRITTDFTLIEKRYIKTTDCWAVYGVDAEDNLLFYWARTLDKVCEVGRISARIKAHNEDSFRGNAKVTTLNYVKVL